MISVSYQLPQLTHDLEQPLAAFHQLTQSLSKEFDRATQLHVQTWQTSWESWNLFCADLIELKDPQEFFIRTTSQAHTVAAQVQQYMQAALTPRQQVQEKIIASVQIISPMMTESIVNVTASPALELPTPSVIEAPSITIVENTVEDTVEDTVEVKVKDTVEVITTIETPAAPIVVRAKRQPSVAKPKVSLIETVAKTEVLSQATTPKVRKVKPTEKIAAEVAEVATTKATPTSPAKKSTVVGLPSKPAAKSGFAGAAGQPEFKAKTSKATGAKKRVRQ